MKKKYVAFLLALSISLSGTMVAVEPYFSTEITEFEEMVTEDIFELEESEETIEVVETQIVDETTEDILEIEEKTESNETTENTELEEIQETTEVLEEQDVVETEITENLLNVENVSQISETANQKDEIVNIPDEKLRSEILKECDNNDDGIITKSEMESLVELSIYSAWSENKVCDLTGIEYAVNLVELDLNSNEISDIHALSELKKLVTLELKDNEISDISALSGLENLETIYLQNNQISDISVLSKLKKLNHIYLYNNQISDISALSELENLRTIDFENNQISDISALSKLKNLCYVYLNDNQINNIGTLTGLENLEALELANNQIKDISGLSGLDNLYYLNLENNQINDISILSSLNKVQGLFLNNNQISDISVLADNKSLQTIDLSNNQIKDISVLSKLENLQDIYLSNNQIKDISILSELENLGEIDLINNQITEIPSFKSCFKMEELLLKGNPLKNIVNAKQLLDVKIEGRIYITASPEYVTPEIQFDNFFDTSERKMYVGNNMKLALEKTYLRTGENVKITYTSQNTDVLSIDENGWMSAQKTGSVDVTATCGNIQKTFKVTILEQEETIKESSEELPSITTDSYEDTVGILDTKGLLWSVNTNKHTEKTELVGTNVKDYYIAEVVYSKDRFSWWSNYIVLNKENTLLEYKKTDENTEYQKNVVAENVKTLAEDGYYKCYLTENDDLYYLYETITGVKSKFIAKNVKNYNLQSYPKKVFTKDGDVILIDNIYYMDNSTVIYSNLGTECVFSKHDNGFLVLNGSTAIYYNGNGEQKAKLENVVEIGVNNSYYASFFAIKSDGTTAEYQDGNWITYTKDSIKFPIQEEFWGNSNKYIIDAENTLWCENEKVAENVTYINNKVYLSNQNVYSLSNYEIMLEDVKKYCVEERYYDGAYHDEIYYLTTEGVVWEVINSETKNQILDNVVDIIVTSSNVSETNVYMIRQDGSVWKYRDYTDTIGIATMILDGNPVVMGDTNGDGTVKINDMLTILHGISGSQTLSENQQLAADIDKDGKVTVRDMLRVMHYISGASNTL